jgi:hypothetical protein
MKSELRAVIMSALVATAAVVVPSQALAQNPPPGAIFDLSTVHPGVLSSTTYTEFNTSFVADNSSEYVSFAFREAPDWFSFDNASVAAAGSPSVNLLADPGFESDTSANLESNFPVDWFRWIQPVDTSAIGEVAGTAYAYGCDSGPASGSYFWCDGSVQGYDALYQELSGLTVGTTYDVTWYLADDSGSGITNPDIDMLVYAGDALPVGSETIGTTPPSVGSTPEPSTFMLLGTGMLGIVRAVRSRRSRKVQLAG